ncbi:sensor histidine kinase [Citreimonas salinaria]|uniref:histidine kinase n=1 Tax=Citreimonas salinaria TaxID=321339 RepID=A0A1H3F9D8_9RHOB|nr:sensor histidine kinase [Citreimonas salinaria]SDX87505.1 Two-component sensor histidine kinase, contains HisKA and HATPase domains [Citreimonas salinaria]
MTAKGLELRVRTFLRRLPVQLIALLTLALFPLGVISLYQTGVVLEEARERNRATLMERTVAAGTLARELIQRASGASQALGSAVVGMDIGACAEALDRFVAADGDFLSARFHAVDGRLLCQSRGTGPAERAAVSRLGPDIQPAEMEISIRPASESYGTPVIRVARPVRDDGGLIGFISLSIPLRIAEALIATSQRATGNNLRLAVVARDGVVLASSHESAGNGGYLPRAMSAETLFELQGATFEAEAGNGETRVFAVSRMINGQAALVGSWPQRAVLGQDWTLATLAPLIFPILMWVIGTIVAYFGLQRLVIRHITALRSAMRQLALGELRGGRIELENPPEELRETERAFNRMVLLLAQAEAKQEQDLRDKEVLLKEVHHRVKNNLQLIGSIMNMQARNARTPEARRVLDSLRNRVRGLATMHRTLYSSPEMTTVQADAMVETLVSDLAGGAAQRRVDVVTRLDPVELYPDQAVPLSMLVAETVTNAVKYVGRREDGVARIEVDLAHDESELVVLTVENTKGSDLHVSDDGAESSGDGLGARLIKAFEQQLHGRSEVVESSDSYRFVLRFHRRDFDNDDAAVPA